MLLTDVWIYMALYIYLLLLFILKFYINSQHFIINVLYKYLYVILNDLQLLEDGWCGLWSKMIVLRDWYHEIKVKQISSR